MAKFIDFPTVYGRIGLQPGELTAEQAIGLFNAGMATPAGGKLAEYWPDTGRSTALLGAVAKNLEGELTVYTTFERGSANEYWFNRTVKTHKLQPVLALNPVGNEAVDMVVVRGEFIKAAEAVADLQAKRLFVLGAAPAALAGWEQKEAGAGYSVWVRHEGD